MYAGMENYEEWLDSARMSDNERRYMLLALFDMCELILTKKESSTFVQDLMDIAEDIDDLCISIGERGGYLSSEYKYT